EAEHGHLYALFGDQYEVDAQNKSVTGPLMASGEYTGVDVTILSGGPAVGFAQPNAQLYSDESIFMAYVGTDEAIAHSVDLPTVGVFQSLEKDPQMIMWDPETYPDVTGIADLGEEGATIRVFPGGVYIDYFVGAGVLKAEQIDTTYDGLPAVFVSEGGAIAQQGFASAEPYVYENEVPEWGKPVDYELINDAGFPKYAAMMSVRPDDVEEYADCLTELVPVLQQAEIDYYDGTLKDSTNALVIELVEAFDTGWVYSEGVAEYSYETQLADGIISNGPDDTLGNFDEARVAELFDIVTPIFAEQGIEVAEGLTPEDLYTNEFVDASLGLE
ncbi:MAG TPA: ABC transporter substrate-binding protein, partial [Rhodoglobus sp.]|nr:ABC transporter substrate-binding protein [Rhodoglobus sp.]